MIHDFKHLKDQLIKGKVSDTIEKLMEIAGNDLKDEKIVKELSMLQYRWEKIESQERQNLLSWDKISTTKSQITKGIIDVMDIIKRRLQLGDSGEARSKKNRKYLYAIGTITLMVIIWLGYSRFFGPHQDDQHDSIFISCPFHQDNMDDVVYYKVLIIPFENYSSKGNPEKIDMALREGLAASTSTLNTLVRISDEEIQIPDPRFARSKLSACNANMLIWGTYEKNDSIDITIKYVTDDLQTSLAGEPFQQFVGSVKSVSSIQSGEFVSKFGEILGITTPFLTGINMIKKGQLNDALRQFEKIDNVNQQVTGIVAKAKGDVHLLKNDYDKAIESYMEALHEGNENAEPYNNIGFALFKKGDMEGALRNFEKASALDPENKDILENFNVTQIEFDNLQNGMGSAHPSVAVEAQQKKIPPPLKQLPLPTICNSFMECNNEGMKLVNQGKTSQALTYFNAAIQYNPRYAEPYLNIGKIYNDAGDYDKAILFYKKAESMDPDFPNTYFNLYTSYYNKGDMDNARKYDMLFDSLTGGSKKLIMNRVIKE